MSLMRFRVPPPLEAGEGGLPPEEARHLRTVFRANVGDRISVFDGAGREAAAEVLSVGRASVTYRTVGTVRSIARPHPRIELLCALPRAGGADDVVRRATEVGADSIRALMCERGVWRPDGGHEARRARFEKAAVAALKQCGLAWIPELPPPIDVPAFESGRGDLVLLAGTRTGGRRLREVLREPPAVERAVAVVGPEGGLTDDEEEGFVRRGALSVSLGPSVLRVETAAVVLLNHLVEALR